MIEMGKQYRTRDGREVRIYAVDGDGIYPVHGAVKIQPPLQTGWAQRSWTNGGSHEIHSVQDSDLIEVKPRIKLERWLNVTREGQVACHLNKISADEWKQDDRIACVRIEIDCEHGEGLETRS